MVEAIAFDNLFKTTTLLDKFRKDLSNCTKEGFHFKAFKSVVDGKIDVRYGATFKRGSLKAYMNTDFKDDHRIYVEKTFKF